VHTDFSGRGWSGAELVNAAFFGWMAALSWTLRLDGARRKRATAWGAVGAVLTLAGYASGSAIVRDWLPAPLMLVAYWQSGPFFVRPNERLQRRLLQLDHRLLGDARLPGGIAQILELAYVFCYPLLPIGLGLLYVSGREAAAGRYWMAILVPTYLCYALLPFLPTAPPRDLEPARPATGIRRLNQWLVHAGSIQANTFPSAHVAATMSAALALCVELPMAGGIFLVVALAIAAATVFGRYHYLADAILGALVAAGWTFWGIR
jgi:membrane-associated phospholipid phosphatase